MNDDSDISPEPLIRIVCAAVQNRESGKVHAGVRHRWIRNSRGLPFVFRYVDGFLTNQGDFLTREQAWTVASAAGQIRPHPATTPGVLHSEDLY